MLKLYKGVFAAYMITVIAGLIALCVVFRGTNPASSVLLIFLVFVWIFICAAVFTAIANTKFGKIRVLFRHCRINESLAKYSALYAKCKDYSYNAILIAYYICSCCLALARGEDGATEYFEHELTVPIKDKSQESPLRDVKIKYSLAVAYEKLGETEKAREYFDFAAKNGGDTYFAAAAKEKLK